MDGLRVWRLNLVIGVLLLVVVWRGRVEMSFWRIGAQLVNSWGIWEGWGEIKGEGVRRTML